MTQLAPATVAPAAILSKESPLRVFVLERDINLAAAILLHIQTEWPEIDVSVVESGEDAFKEVRNQPPGLVVIDLGTAPGAVTVCATLRRLTSAPIVALFDPAVGAGLALSAGADDAVAKPFLDRALQTALSKWLNRPLARDPTERVAIYEDGLLNLAFGSHEVRVRGRIVRLTPIQFSMLALLVRNHGRVVTAKELRREAWGAPPSDAPPPGEVKWHIANLRRRLPVSPSGGPLIESLRGVGYRYAG